MSSRSLGLAPLMVAEVFRAIGELRRQGQTILLVEQNLRQALAVSDYAYVLENGKVVLEGTPEAVLADGHTRRAYLGL